MLVVARKAGEDQAIFECNIVCPESRSSTSCNQSAQHFTRCYVTKQATNNLTIQRSEVYC
eukprot:2127046-Pleurochrysis_carterae.AAC.1